MINIILYDVGILLEKHRILGRIRAYILGLTAIVPQDEHDDGLEAHGD